MNKWRNTGSKNKLQTVEHTYMLTIEGIVPQQPRKYLSYIEALRSKYEILDTYIVSEDMSGRAKSDTDGKKVRGMHLFLFMIDNAWATCKNFK